MPIAANAKKCQAAPGGIGGTPQGRRRPLSLLRWARQSTYNRANIPVETNSTWETHDRD
jgi:hypothetical protein